MESLKSRTIKGVGWGTLQSLLNYGVGFVVGIVLARLLGPGDYGLIGMAVIFINLSQAIIDSGLSSSLIRKKDASDEDFQTVFLVNMGISVLMYGFLFLIAPVIATFFKEPRLVAVLRVLTVVLFFNALSMVQRTKLTKKIDFKSLTKASVSAALISGVVGISMAYMGYGVWALVAQRLVQEFVRTIALWWCSKWIPRLQFSKERFKEHFSFGWKLLVSGILSSTMREATNAVIGRCYSALSLGYYTKARRFTTMVSQNLTSIVQSVTYPSLSEIQDDKERLRSAYRTTIRVTMLVTFSAMLMLAAIAKPLVLTLIGEKWLPTVGMLQVTCFYMMLYPLHSLNLNMLQVAGRSDLYLRLEIIKTALITVPLTLGVWKSIYWMLWGYVAIGFVAYYLNAYYSGRFVGYSMLQQVRDILPDFLVAAISAAAVWTITLLPFNCYVQLACQCVLGLGLIIGLCKLFKLPEYEEIKTIVYQYIKK